MKEVKPLISFIIPVYNAAQYIERCLLSILRQDTADAVIECIIVDDCGMDNSMEIVSRAIASYHGHIFFRIISHEKNSGPSASRNTGLKEAKGDYVFFIDSDDYLLPHAIRYMLDALHAYPKADIIVGNVRMGKDNTSLMPWLQTATYITDNVTIMFDMMHYRLNKYAWNKLIRRRLALQFDVNIRINEDVLWSYQVLQQTSSVLLIPQETYYYTENPTSIVNTMISTDLAEKNIRSYIALCRYLLCHPLPMQPYGRRLEVDYLLFVCNNIMQGVDLCKKGNVSRNVLADFHSLKNKFVNTCISRKRLLIAVFSLNMYWPLTTLLNFSAFRRLYFYMEKVVGKMSHVTDFVHG